MDPYANEWLDLLVRWLHVIAAIAWIGASFYFIASTTTCAHLPTKAV